MTSSVTEVLRGSLVDPQLMRSVSTWPLQSRFLDRSLTGNVTTFSYDARNQISSSVTETVPVSRFRPRPMRSVSTAGARATSSVDHLTEDWATTFAYGANSPDDLFCHKRSFRVLLSTATYEIGVDGHLQESRFLDRSPTSNVGLLL